MFELKSISFIFENEDEEYSKSNEFFEEFSVKSIFLNFCNFFGSLDFLYDNPKKLCKQKFDF